MSIPSSVAAEDPGTNQPNYLAKVRHELRTPINHIIGYCEMVQEEADGKVPEAFSADLERIHSGGKDLLGLINEHFGDDTFDPNNRDSEDVFFRLRTPVNHIIGYAELLQEQAEEMGQAELIPDLQKIHAAASKWLALMEQHLGPSAVVPVLNLASKEAPAVEQALPSKVQEGVLLVVDDDDANREILGRRLGRQGYTVVEAENGTTALEKARTERPDLVLLDMVMPDLSGYEVLARLKGDDALRDIPVVMLSAMDDMDSIVRCILLGAEDYLAKPFNPILLRARIGACLERRRLALAEQELLDKTLNGSIQMLTEILSMTDPEAFGRSQTLRDLMRTITQTLHVSQPWELEVAAMLSQIGYVTIPATVVEKVRRGMPLRSSEQEMVTRVVEIGSKLLGNIPRLESVAQIVLYQNKRFDGSGFPEDNVGKDQLPLGARILRILNELVDLEAKDVSKAEALSQMRRRPDVFDLTLIDAVAGGFRKSEEQEVASSQTGSAIPVALDEIWVNDVLAVDVKTNDEMLIVRAGTKVSEVLMEKLRNFAELSGIKEPLQVQRQGRQD